MAPDGTRGAKSEASENSNNRDHPQEFDEGESGWLTQRTPSPDRVGVKTPRVTFQHGTNLCERSGLGVRKYFLVERGKGGCSHSDELILA